jgi:hypothetical protein
VKIYVAPDVVAQEKGNTAWNSVYHPNLWKNQFGSQLFPFVKNFIPNYAFDALLCRNWSFSPT